MCSTTPRFSYRVPKTCVNGYEHGSGTVCQRVGTGWVWGPGGYWVGIPGEYPAAKDVHAKRRDDSGAGPGSPGTGLEWVVIL